MSPDELISAIELAREAAEEAAVELKNNFGNVEFSTKNDGDAAEGVVTQLDKDTEQLIKDRLTGFSSDIGFQGEEFGKSGSEDKYWLVDPIDGTAHFIRGIPLCTTMIALVVDGVVMGSVIHDFVTGDSYWAIRGQGAYMNDDKISVSNRTLRESYIAYESQLQKGDNFEKFIILHKKAVLPTFINCGKDFINIAIGKLDGRIMLDPWGEDWDFAPGSLLVEEAGGKVTNIGSTNFNFMNHNILAVNPVVYEELTSGPDAIFPIR